eukprot:gene10947-biopygen18351
MRTAARTRSGPANDMGGTRDVRLAETRFCCRLSERFVTDSQGVPDDVRGGTGHARATPAPPKGKHGVQPAPRPRQVPVPPGKGFLEMAFQSW